MISKTFYAYHVVTEKPMKLGQIIVFDEINHSGMYERVYKLKNIVDDIYNNPIKYKNKELDHHTKVALRELALEEERQKNHKNLPSRLSSLYVSSKLSDSYSWAEYFKRLNRNVCQIVKIKIKGNSFTGDSHNCFEGTIDKNKNLEFSKKYWNNLPNDKLLPPVHETIVDGKITVVKVIEDFNNNNI